MDFAAAPKQLGQPPERRPLSDTEMRATKPTESAVAPHKEVRHRLSSLKTFGQTWYLPVLQPVNEAPPAAGIGQDCTDVIPSALDVTRNGKECDWARTVTRIVKKWYGRGRIMRDLILGTL